MELKDLILLMWRKIGYIILGLIVGAGIGIAVSLIQSPVYEATTKVFVSRARQQSNADTLSLSDEQLLAINLQLAKSPSVLDEVSTQLGSKINADNIQVGTIPNTPIIQIKVQDTDPKRAATIANLLVQTLIQQNETLLSARYIEFENSTSEKIDQVQNEIASLQTQINELNNTGIEEQLSQVNQQIEQLDTEITGLEQEIASFSEIPSPLERISLAEKQAQLNQLRSSLTIYQQIQTNLIYIGKPGQTGLGPENPRLAALQSTLDLYQQMNLSLINSRESIRLARAQIGQNVMQIVSATPPKNPIRPMPVLYSLLAGFIGLALTATAILILDQFDGSFKAPSQVEALGIPFLGSVFDIKNTPNGLITTHEPHLTKEMEAFRVLGASMDIANAREGIHTILVANAGPAERKTTIAANLAIVSAQQGKKIILMDGDLKHPYLHSLFGVENKKGLVEILNGRLDIQNAVHTVENVTGMALITSGIAENGLTSWLDAEKLSQLLSELQKHADLVIVESPSPDTADAQILASKMDAVFLVITAGHTRIDSTQIILNRFKLMGARVLGAVMNHTSTSRMKLTQISSLIKIQALNKETAQVMKSESNEAPAPPS
jgi:capsular exopolysaccharide synthesis family protein